MPITFRKYVKAAVLASLSKHYCIPADKTTIRFYTDNTKNQTRVKLLVFIQNDSIPVPLDKIEYLFKDLPMDGIKTSVPLVKVANNGLVDVENHKEFQTLFYFKCAGRADDDVKKVIKKLFSKHFNKSGIEVVSGCGGSNPLNKQTILINNIDNSDTLLRTIEVGVSFPNDLFSINTLPCSVKLLAAIRKAFPNELVSSSTNFKISNGRATMQITLTKPKQIFIS